MRHLKTLIAHVALAFAASTAAAPAVAVALTAPGVVAQARGAELAALEASWEEAVSRREHLVGMMGEVEEEYDVLAGHIERLKREGADGDLRRQRLEALLREARPLAEQLQQMQRAVVQNDEEIAELSEAIVAIMDAKMRRAEREMASASASARAALVKDLNALSARRARYARPHPHI
jgi:chromosome segregation ATPase